ncbi:MAG: galactose mutarotase [Butyricicoccus sp.]|nr:galactose mutarotase [Butyricicoccus sp.]
MSENNARRVFGTTPAGETVEVISISNGTLSAEVITYGASLRSLMVPGRDGKLLDVVLGYDDIETYCSLGGHFGAVCGRFANRIAEGKFTLDGKTYQLALNNGPNHLHGGPGGYSKRVWEVAEVTDSSVTLQLDSPDGDENYPGHVKVRMTYALEGSSISFKYEAISDKATPLNLTNHTYFNLAGHDTGSCEDQIVKLYCSKYTPANNVSIPRGSVKPVEGTPFDFREPMPIGLHIGDDNTQLKNAKGYDHNMVVDGEQGTMRPAAWAKSDKSGITILCETDLPGMQFYTGNGISPRTVKGGAKYDARHGFCLETQFYPNSPNVLTFPSCILHADEVFESTTRFTFGIE